MTAEIGVSDVQLGCRKRLLPGGCNHLPLTERRPSARASTLVRSYLQLSKAGAHRLCERERLLDEGGPETSRHHLPVRLAILGHENIELIYLLMRIPVAGNERDRSEERRVGKEC